jgi:predicted dehydrogenase
MSEKPVVSTAADPTSFSRRSFLAGATAAGLTIVKPELVRAAGANAKIRLGLIGCGGRGRWIADLFSKHGGYEFVALADYFPDRVDKAGEGLKVSEKKRFTGLSAYQRLLDTKPDAVVVESPPFFHPQHALAAVHAGCHVFCAKPIAVDVPGCLTIAEAGRAATAAKRCMLVDFQSRANAVHQEALRRVHAGDIGPIVSGDALYYTGSGQCGKLDMADPEVRLRYWVLDRVLSGDVIVEQNIHAIDMACWAINQQPLKAVGACSKKGRIDPGDDNDHFSVLFTFPNDVLLNFASKQFGAGCEEILSRMFGPEGTLEEHYWGRVFISGKKSYKGANIGTLYTDGAVSNIAAFHDKILAGDWSNSTVAPSVRSNLTAILGRTAAYKKTEVTWDEMMRTAEKYELPTAGLKV